MLQKKMKIFMHDFFSEFWRIFLTLLEKIFIHLKLYSDIFDAFFAFHGRQVRLHPRTQKIAYNASNYMDDVIQIYINVGIYEQSFLRKDLNMI